MSLKLRKTLRNNLRSEAQELLLKVMPNMHQRTINKYTDDIRYKDNVNSLRKAIRELTVLNEAIKPPKNLTRQLIKGVLKENRELKSVLESMADRVRDRRAYERKALGGTFHEHYIYADQIPAMNKINSLDKLNDDNIIHKMLTRKLNEILKYANNIKDKKVSIKSFVIIKCVMERHIYDEDGNITQTRDHFYNSPVRNIVSSNNINTFVNDVIQGFLESITQSQNGSDWIFKKFIKFTIATNRYKSVFGRSYIPLPKEIENKKACVNIKNKDNKCFEWCLLANKYYDVIKSDHKNKVNNYMQYTNEINRPDDIQYPVTTDDIHKYEELNNIQINVFKLTKLPEDVEDVRPYIEVCYKSNQHRKEVVNLLLIEDGEMFHYVLIRQLSRLFNSRTCNVVRYFCPHCITKFTYSMDKLNEHVEKCANYSESEKLNCDVVINMPEKYEKDVMYFKNKGNKMLHPFHVIADFESTLATFEDDENKSTTRYQKHMQNSFGLKFCSVHEEYNDDKVVIFDRPDPEIVSKQFIEK